MSGHNLDPALQCDLEAWRYAGQPDRHVDVFVSYSGKPAQLTEAGLELGHYDGVVATGSVRLADVLSLAMVDGVTRIAAAARAHLQIDRSMGELRALDLRSNVPPYAIAGVPGLTGKGVLVGVIDDMISEFHRSFIKPNTNPQTTRIVGIWDQKAAGPPRPAGFTYGRLWDEAAINAVLAARNVSAIRLTAPLDHGSHVTGIAAGNGAFKDQQFPPYTFVGVAPEADIAFTNGAFSASARVIADALAFIFGLATQRGQPCVVNMSFGTHEGARDGTSDLELAIDRLLHGPGGEPLPGRAVIAAAGNEASMRRHSRKTIDANGTAAFRLDVEKITFPIGQPLTEDLIDDRFYVWYDGAASLDIRITPARSTPSGWTRPSQTSTVSIRGVPVAILASPAHPEPNGKRKIVVSMPAPVRLGRWTVEVRNTAGVPATIDLWVDRNGDGDIWPQLSPSDNVIDNTVTCPNTCKSVISVGAYTSEPGNPQFGEHYGEICSFSSRGLDNAYNVTLDRIRPHLVAPGRRIISANRSSYIDERQDYFRFRYGGLTLGSHAVMNGTSQAAPHVTGVVALMFQKNPTLTYRDLRQILMGTARRDQIPDGLVLPNAIWGAGKVDAAAALGLTPAAP